MPSYFKCRPLLFVAAIALVSLLGPSRGAEASSNGVVISSVYTRGGSAGSTYTNKYVELFNGGSSAVDIGGWSVRYLAAANSNWPMSGSGFSSIPSFNLQPGQYYLIQGGSNGTTTNPLPAPDVIGAIQSASMAGKVALFTGNAACATANPSTCSGFVDFIGYGASVNASETNFAPAATLVTQMIARKGGGCLDSDNNANDFELLSASARNSASPLAPCGAPDPCLPYSFPYTLAGNSAAELRQALLCANLNATTDVINLNAQTIVLSDSYADYLGDTGMPQVVSTLTIRNGAITRNGANLFRLLSVAASGNLTLDQVQLSNGHGKHVGAQTGGGGAVDNQGALTMTNCVMTGNFSEFDGGALRNLGGTVSISSSVFAGNHVDVSGARQGGAISNTGNLTISNSLLHGNRASRGGGIHSAATLTANNLTVAANLAADAGGGLYNDISATLNLNNTLVYGNQATGLPASAEVSGASTNQFSVVGINPSFLNLIDPVAHAPTLAGDYRLGNNSVAIDAGSNNLIPGGIISDLDGNPRRYDDTDVSDTGAGSTPIVDIGAYEKQTNSAGACASYLFPYTLIGNTQAELVAAINCSESNGPSADIIDLNGQTVTLNSVAGVYYSSDASGLPQITKALVLRNGVLLRDSAAPAFNFLNVTGGTLTAQNITFNNGHVSLAGGALHCSSGTISVSSSTFINNISDDSGGAVFTSNCTATITNSVMSGNVAVENGSAVYSVSGITSLTNSLVSGNRGVGTSGGSGTAIDANNASFVINNSTIAGNYARVVGGIIVFSASVVLNNSLVYGNETLEGAEQIFGAFTINNSLVGIDPAFVNPLDASEQAPTTGGNYRLSDHSVAIDAGNNGMVLGMTDLDGANRFYNDVGVPDTGIGSPPLIDLGAFEKQSNSPLPQADVSVSNDNNASISVPGTAVTYTITATNAGPAAASATVQANFPANLTGVVWTIVASGGASCGADGSGNINQVLSLPNGASCIFTTTATIDAAATGTLSISATASVSGAVDPVSVNNVAIDTDTLRPESDISVAQTAIFTPPPPPNGYVNVGRTYNYQIIVSNAGPSVAANIGTLEANFPAPLTNTELVIASSSNGSTCQQSPLGALPGTLSRSIDLLPVGGSCTYTAMPLT